MEVDDKPKIFPVNVDQVQLSTVTSLIDGVPSLYALHIADGQYCASMFYATEQDQRDAESEIRLNDGEALYYDLDDLYEDEWDENTMVMCDPLAIRLIEYEKAWPENTHRQVYWSEDRTGDCYARATSYAVDVPQPAIDEPRILIVAPHDSPADPWKTTPWEVCHVERRAECVYLTCGDEHRHTSLYCLAVDERRAIQLESALRERRTHILAINESLKCLVYCPGCAGSWINYTSLGFARLSPVEQGRLFTLIQEMLEERQRRYDLMTKK